MRTTSKRRGFSLMEVLIAMGIAGVGLCGILTALPVIAFQVQKVRSQVSGDQLAQIAQETIWLQGWADPKTAGGGSGNSDLAWVIDNSPASYDVPVAAPFLIDPWSDTNPFSGFNFGQLPLLPSVVTVGDLDGDGTANTATDKIFSFRSFFTDPSSLKVSANPSSERPELTYVSFPSPNGPTIAPDRNDDYSWFYTVLPKVDTVGLPSPVPVGNIAAYHVSVVVSRARAFDDPDTHRVYTINTTRRGSRADTVEVAGDAAIGKYAAVVIPGTFQAGDLSGEFGVYCLWYKVLIARATTAGTTRVLLQPIKPPNNADLPDLPPLATGFLITADSIIEVQSFSTH